MLALLALATTSTVAALPQGYVIDCRSCPAEVKRVHLVVHLVAQDGTKFTTGKMWFPSDPTSAQTILIAGIEDSGFVVRKGEGDRVIIFGPKGQSVKSIKFESAEWMPVYRRFYGK